MSTEHGQASYRNVKGRRIAGLSIGYAIRSAVKTAEGNELRDLELVEISIVARSANPQRSSPQSNRLAMTSLNISVQRWRVRASQHERRTTQCTTTRVTSQNAI